MRKMSFASMMVAGLSTASIASLASAQLFNQPVHTPGQAGANGLSAFQGNLGVAGEDFDREIADDFTVLDAPGWRITSIGSQWVQFTNNDPTPVTGAEIRFFERTGAGGVGSQVGSTILLGAADISINTTSDLYFGRNMRDVEMFLPGAGVDLGVGEYFVQVQLLVDHNWFWLTATGTGDPLNLSGAHLRRGPDAMNTDPTWPTDWSPAAVVFGVDYDQSLQLYGSIIPAPGALALLGVAGLIARRRRRA